MATINEKVSKLLNKIDEEEKKKKEENEDIVVSLASNSSNKYQEMINEVQKTQDEIDGIYNKGNSENGYIEVNPLSEEELLKQAIEKVEAEQKETIEKLSNSKNDNIEKLNKKNDSIVSEGEIEKKKVVKSASEKEQKTYDDAIKKGVQRSSILTSQLSNLSEDKIQKQLDIEKEVAEKLFENNKKIKEYEKEYDKAISNLETTKAVEIKNKLVELKKEQDKEIAEIIKHNNSLGVITSSEQLNKINELKRNKLTIALRYFYSMPKEEALKEATDNEELKILLDNSYQTLLNYLKNR